MPTPERLGKYLVRGELGRGAMGIVYEGFDPLIERTVAIKVLHIEPANAALAAELQLRFRREAQAAGRLSHPNIVSVYDYGEEAELSAAFIAMELVRGPDLKRLFDSGKRFTLHETARIMDGLLAALRHAHERGVIHRDIKPGNILLLDDGSVKVTDFGIAKIDTSELTQWGAVLGTVSHMSPEQMSGQPVDRRSDLYSCGVILYQLLTGERPFSGSPTTVMQKVLHEQPLAPSLLASGLPPGIDAVVRQAMAKSPAQRHASAAAFADALNAALAGRMDPDATIVVSGTEATERGAAAAAPPAAAPPPAAPAAKAAHSAPAPTIAGLALLGVAAAGAAAWWWSQPRAAAPATQAAGPQPMPLPAASAPSSAAVVVAVPAAVPASPAAAPASLAAEQRPPTAVAPSDEEIEQLAWADAAKANTRLAYQAYLRSYPQGRFASRAHVRIAALQPEPSAAAPAPSTAPAPGARTAAAPAPTPAPAPSPSPAPATPTGKPQSAPAPRPAEPRQAAPPPRAEPSAAPARSPGLGLPASPAPPAPSAASRQAAKSEPECAEPARRGDARCQVALGLLYRQGKGVPQNAAAAVGWFRKAADQGFAAGQHELGVAYATGQGVRADPNEALRWFRKAADQGEARSQNRLGQAYENGETGARNLVLAADWYRKAADQGLPVAMTNLGRMYLHGRGVFQDNAKAAELLHKAAEQGEANARFHLGWMYEKGQGKPRDVQQAARLYRQALAGASLSERNRQAATAFLNSKPAP